MGYYSSFVVKIWADDDGKMGRGYVQHVSTEESIHFLTLDQMVAFVKNHLNPPPNHGVDVQEGTLRGKRK